MGEANTKHILLICHSMLLTMLIETAVHWFSGYGTLSVVQNFNIDFIGINGWPEWWLFLGSVTDWMETKLLNVVVQALGETEQDLSSWVGKVFSLKTQYPHRRVTGLLAYILVLCLGCGEGEEVLDPGRERERKLIFEIWGSWWQDVYISFNIIVLKVDFIHFQFFTEHYRSSSFSFTNPLNVSNLNGDFIFPFSVTDPLQRPWYLGEKLFKKYLPSE